MRPLMILAVLAGLSACTSGPSPIWVVARPFDPGTSPAAFALDADARHLDSETLADLNAAFERAGWRRTSDPAHASDVSQVLVRYAVRSETVGAYAGSVAPSSPEDWATAPQRASWWRPARQVHELTIDVQSTNGQPLATARATQSMATADPDARRRLADEAVRALMSGGVDVGGSLRQ